MVAAHEIADLLELFESRPIKLRDCPKGAETALKYGGRQHNDKEFVDRAGDTGKKDFFSRNFWVQTRVIIPEEESKVKGGKEIANKDFALVNTQRYRNF